MPVARWRPLARLTWAIALALAVLSVLRPWDEIATTAEPQGVAASQSTGVAGASPRVTGPPPGSPASDEILCPQSGWQLVSLDRLADWTVRSWTPAAPEPATGPSDPGIQELPLDSPVVLALGVCAPTVESGGPRLTTGRTRIVALWRRDVTGLSPVPVETVGRARNDLATALLYRPVTSPPAAPGSWSPGHYVAEIDPEDPTAPGTPSAGDAAGPAGTVMPGLFIGLFVPGPG